MQTALYRKYRPQEFKDVVGQDHVVDVLQKSLKKGDIAHAYLFSGSRGTGKTSVARILANELGTSGNDVYEIDAASNRGIDDIRELRESVRTLPFDSKYKVYIIDEVHMLTKEAFNALLKTLEEPPAHVIFILATTELDKVPETIISRCQTYLFKTPTNAVLKELAKDIAKKEGYTLDNGGAELVALLGDGSFRDMHGMLQKVFSFSTDKKITRGEIEKVTGAPKNILVQEFLSAIATDDIEKGLLAVRQAGEDNIDMKLYLKLVLHQLRLALLLRFAPEMKKTIEADLSEDEVTFLKELLATKSAHLSSKALSLLLEAYQDMRYAFIPSLPLELALVKILKGE